MKTCVIFAASVFDPSRLNVIEDFFSNFKHNFADAEFYVGINYGSIPTLESEIEKYGLNCIIQRASNGSLYTRTDASAYQLALKLLKDSGKKYDVYWFGHSKGAVNSRPEERKMYLNDFFSQRQTIEKMFQTYPALGSWGIRGNSISGAGVRWTDYNVDSYVPICQNVLIPPFKYTHVNWSYIETLYTLKKEAVEAYVDALPPEFFTTKLDPWYAETVIPWVPSRCGYFPYVKTNRCFFDKCNLKDVTKQWIDENGLTDLLPYLEL